MNTAIQDQRYWNAFLRYLVDEEMFDAHQLLSVVEKPWKWEEEYEQFVRENWT